MSAAGSFGIDLGTTNSLIARLVDGRPVAIPIDDHPIVPSVVLYQEDRVVVGREAKNLELQYPEATIRSVKRRMGQDHHYQIGGRAISPAEVSAEILSALKRGAERATGEEVRDVVITVPAYFDDAQRRATLEAGERAGLNVLRLLNEPTSASLVYDQVGAAPDDTSEMVLVYDLGGGTFDVSVLKPDRSSPGEADPDSTAPVRSGQRTAAGRTWIERAAGEIARQRSRDGRLPPSRGSSS